MTLRNKFPFNAILKIIDKVISIGGLIKMIISILKNQEKDNDSK